MWAHQSGPWCCLCLELRGGIHHCRKKRLSGFRFCEAECRASVISSKKTNQQHNLSSICGCLFVTKPKTVVKWYSGACGHFSSIAQFSIVWWRRVFSPMYDCLANEVEMLERVYVEQTATVNGEYARGSEMTILPRANLRHKSCFCSRTTSVSWVWFPCHVVSYPSFFYDKYNHMLSVRLD